MKDPWVLSKASQGLYCIEESDTQPAADSVLHKDSICDINNVIVHSSINTVRVNKDVVSQAKLWHLRLGHISFHQLKLIFPVID